MSGGKVGNPGPVDGRTEAAEDRNAQRTAEFTARFGHPGGRSGLLRRGAAHDEPVASVITGASPSEITTEAAAMRMRAPSPSTDRPSSIVVPIAATAIPMPMMTDGR